MANKVDLSHKLNTEIIRTGLSRIRPFILVEREAPIRNNYWNAFNGQSAGGGNWQIDVQSPTGIPANILWFNPGERVFIKGKTEGGTATDTAYQIVSRSLISGDQAVRLVMEPQNSNSFLSADQLTSPTSGLLVRGTANVSDFESFCSRPPGLITNNEDEFWIETTRDAQCIDELYEEWRDLVISNNPLYAKFYDLEPVKYNKQSGEDFQRRWVNTAFFNKALANQTLADFNSLENIESVEPNDVNRCVGKRANAIGIYEQHAQAKRVIDLQGGQLNLPALFNTLYTMQRLREDIGAAQSDIFEVGMPNQFYPAFRLAMLQYYKAQSNGMEQLFVENEKGGFKKSPFGMRYMDFPLIYPNATIRVVTDYFFDDYLSANKQAGQEDVGRLLWILDWSKIYVGVFESNRVVNKTGDLKTLAAVDPTFACVMRVPTQTTTLMSFTWTLICEAPQANLIVHNFSGETPEAVVEQGNYDTTCATTTTSTTTTTTTTGA